MAQSSKEGGERVPGKNDKSKGSGRWLRGEGGQDLISSFLVLPNFRILGLIADDDPENNLFPISGILKTVFYT